jgi:hypothetical protein
MKKRLYVFIACLYALEIQAQSFPTGILTAPLPGPLLSPTPVVLSSVTALDGVVMIPSISLGGSTCTYTNAGSQADYDNDQFIPFPQGSTSPMALQIRLPSPAVNCPGTFIKTKLDLSTGIRKPQDISFKLADVDNRFDSGRVLIYSAGNLVIYNYTLSTSTHVRVFNGSNVQQAGLTGSGNDLHFTGTSNANVNPTNANWVRGTVSINVPPTVTIDSIVYIRYLFAGTGPSASTTIGDFLWPGSVLPVRRAQISVKDKNCKKVITGVIDNKENIEKITVEKSVSGKFTATGEIKQPDTNFEFTDNEVTPGTCIYRFKISLKNGSPIYSNEVKAVNYCAEKLQATLLPNYVVNGSGCVTIHFTKSFSGNMLIMNAAGQAVTDRVSLLNSFSRQLNIQSLAKGFYYVILNDNYHQSQKLKLIIL